MVLHRGTSLGLLGKTRAVLYEQREMADRIIYIISQSDVVYNNEKEREENVIYKRECEMIRE